MILKTVVKALQLGKPSFVVTDKIKKIIDLVFLNIGGISNLTYLNKDKEFASFDSGPGNFLIDKTLQVKSNNKTQFDKDGMIAFSGNINKNILDIYLNDPYYKICRQNL